MINIIEVLPLYIVESERGILLNKKSNPVREKSLRYTGTCSIAKAFRISNSENAGESSIVVQTVPEEAAIRGLCSSPCGIGYNSCSFSNLHFKSGTSAINRCTNKYVRVKMARVGVR